MALKTIYDESNDLKPGQVLKLQDFQLPKDWLVLHANRINQRDPAAKTSQWKVRLELVDFKKAQPIVDDSKALDELKTIECIVDNYDRLDELNLGYHEIARIQLVDPQIMVHPRANLPGFTDSVSPYRLLVKDVIIKPI